MKTHVEVMGGDITRVGADVLITAVSSDDVYIGPIDEAIQRCAGMAFHNQLAQFNRQDGDMVLALGGGHHNGMFKNVLFAIDDMRQPLRELVATALKAVEAQGFITITLSALRMSGAKEARRKDEDALAELAIAILAFTASNPKNVKRISIVVRNNPSDIERLKEMLGFQSK